MHKTTTLAEDLGISFKVSRTKNVNVLCDVTFLENFGSDINVGAFNSESLLFTVKDNKFSVGSVAGRIYRV